MVVFGLGLFAFRMGFMCSGLIRVERHWAERGWMWGFGGLRDGLALFGMPGPIGPTLTGVKRNRFQDGIK